MDNAPSTSGLYPPLPNLPERSPRPSILVVHADGEHHHNEPHECETPTTPSEENRCFSKSVVLNPSNLLDVPIERRTRTVTFSDLPPNKIYIPAYRTVSASDASDGSVSEKISASPIVTETPVPNSRRKWIIGGVVVTVLVLAIVAIIVVAVVVHK